MPSVQLIILVVPHVYVNLFSWSISLIHIAHTPFQCFCNPFQQVPLKVSSQQFSPLLRMPLLIAIILLNFIVVFGIWSQAYSLDCRVLSTVLFFSSKGYSDSYSDYSSHLVTFNISVVLAFIFISNSVGIVSSLLIIVCRTS